MSRERYAGGESVGTYLAGLYAGLGEKDKAFALLEKDFQQHTGELPTITFWLSLEGLRNDLRYADLLRRIGLQRLSEHSLAYHRRDVRRTVTADESVTSVQTQRFIKGTCENG